MRPIKLHFYGFGSYAGEETLDFAKELPDGGLFLIHGATGAGKTTILDAITYALYGKASGEGRKEGRSLRADRAAVGEPTYVELTFGLGASRYRIYRSMDLVVEGRKTPLPGRAELYRIGADGEEQALETTKSAVNTRIETLLGITRDQFCQIVLLPQGDFQQFLMANSKDRSAILQKLFRTERYQEIETRLKNRAEELKKAGDELLKNENILLESLGCASREMLAEKIAAGKKELERLTAEIGKAESDNEKKKKALSTGESVFNDFKISAERAAELLKKEALIPKQEEYKKILERAKRAVVPMERESRASALADEAKRREETARAALVAAKSEETRAAAAEKTLAAEEAREYEREKLRRERAQLETLVGAAAAYQGALIEARRAAAAAEKAAADERENARAAEKLAADEAALEKEKTALEAAAKDEKALEMALEKEREKGAAAEKCRTHEEALKKSRAKHEGLKKDAAAQKKAAEDAQKNADRLRELLRLGTAYTLAASLRDGEPCPVCGATQHPAPAKTEGIIPTKDEVERAEAAARTAGEARERASEAALHEEGEVRRLESLYSEALEALGGAIPAADARKAALAAAEERYAAAKKAGASLTKLGERAAALTREKTALEAKKKATAEALQSAKAAEGAARGRVGEMEKNLPEELRADGAAEQKLAAVTAALKAADERLTKAREAAKAARELAAQKKAELESARREEQKARDAAAKGREDFLTSLKESSLDEADYRAIAGDKNWRSADFRSRAEERIGAFQQELAAIRKAADDAKKRIAGKEKPDLEALTVAAKEAQARLNACTEARGKSREETERLERAERDIAENQKKHAEADKAYRIAGRLAGVATGEYGMHFQTYVQRSIFHDVMDAANRRLSVMSRGRFELVMGELGQDHHSGKSWEGLELAVLDAETGRSRSVRSLSGGESFLASLSLALGLADVVQSYAGGVSLEAMFIDEGFGSLDAETLDMVLDALISLQGDTGRLVGIISHVAELETRIPTRLEVTRTATGSHAHFETGVHEG